ncbi:hypothetical protein O6P43_006468 [Quillaja saponaria]|uniref:Uncharacterized protein n=1 Tax=Quillaja saponaria TaxID=32244 RepID=A0AAD7Q879_QUISA|nr:hypothetical protein O6P43_006468 [Quillaja saponaria]
MGKMKMKRSWATVDSIECIEIEFNLNATIHNDHKLMRKIMKTKMKDMAIIDICQDKIKELKTTKSKSIFLPSVATSTSKPSLIGFMK